MKDFISAKERLAPLPVNRGWADAYNFLLGAVIMFLLIVSIGGN